jgi:DNA-binding transcriptional ArsR family regulator
MVKRRPDLDAVFSALADPTRRRIVERLVREELTVGEIASAFPISQPAVSKHVKILEESGLLVRRIDGRVHRCRLAPAAMRDAARWLEEQERFWHGALDNLDDFLTRTSTDKEQR